MRFKPLHNKTLYKRYTILTCLQYFAVLKIWEQNNGHFLLIINSMLQLQTHITLSLPCPAQPFISLEISPQYTAVIQKGLFCNCSCIWVIFKKKKKKHFLSNLELFYSPRNHNRWADLSLFHWKKKKIIRGLIPSMENSSGNSIFFFRKVKEN